MNDYIGLVGFSTGKGFISKAIRWFRKSEYSHTFIVIGKLNNDQIIISEADTFKVRLAPLSGKIKKDSKVELWKLDIPDNILLYGVDQVINLTGKSYGWFQLLGFIWIWLMEKFGIKVSNPFHNGIICSELSNYFVEEVGYDLLDMKPNDIAPDHLIKTFIKDGTSELFAKSDFDEEELIIL